MADPHMRIWVVVNRTGLPPWRYHLSRECASLWGASFAPIEAWTLGELLDVDPSVTACLSCIRQVAAERES